MIIQFCGLSGAGKTTLAKIAKQSLLQKNILVEIIDGDEYRKMLGADLGFSKKDRNTNIRRLAFVASRLSNFKIVSIICAINPYDEIRQEIKNMYPDVKTIFIDCNVEELKKRDTKGLYKKAALPDNHPDKIFNLTGINDPFETPSNPDLIIQTDVESVDNAAKKLIQFILDNYKRS